MFIRKFGLTLRRLEATDLELVRLHRNSETVRRHMVYRGDISKEMQQQWFTEIDSPEHYYFIIESGGDAVGLVNGRNIDFDKRTGDAGLFMWPPENGPPVTPETAVIACVLILSFTFDVLGLVRAYSKIRIDNSAAEAFNRQLGFRRSASRGPDEPESCWWEITPDSFFETTQRVRRGIGLSFDEPPDFSLDDVYFEQADVDRFDRLYVPVPADVRQRFALRLKAMA